MISHRSLSRLGSAAARVSRQATARHSPSCSPFFVTSIHGTDASTSTNAFSVDHSRFFASDANNDANKDVDAPIKTSMEFKAETRQLLDIVTHSLYTDKEVFLRELISNASDALEKLRHVQSSGQSSTIDPDLPLEIRIETDEVNSTLTISDTGIGLSRDDMISNLGTIAKSGSKAFVSEIERKSQDGDFDASKGIIGRFGVGFYSAFMIGDKVEVRSKPAVMQEQAPTPAPQLWSSEGVGSFDISDLPEDIRQDRGASVVIHLKDDYPEFADESNIEKILKKYSNFVNFPIFLNGNRVNTMEAIWSKDVKDIDDDTYTAFYKFISNAYDEPLDKLHFKADAPIEIKALFYIPSFHSEKYGMGRMEPGVSLYSRKILIEAKSPDILPDWLRFVKGVVDSEDLPLSISREKAQDSALITKLRRVLTRKFISHLTNMAKKRTETYKDEFYREYQFFLKEGICQDHEFQEPLSKLLYFETSKTLNGEIASFDEYVSRMKPEQKEIYFLCAPSRELAQQSPYLEAFEKTGREVIFVYTAIDDFVMANLEKFQGRALVSAEKSGIDLGDDDNDDGNDDETGKGDDNENSSSGLTKKEREEFCAWFQVTLPEQVASCKTTSRLASSPAVVTDNESGAMRRMMRMVDTSGDGGREAVPLPKQQVEINPEHPIIVGINSIRESEPTLARVLAEQVMDNCLVAAGLLDDGRSMLPRLNDILLTVVKGATASSTTVTKETSATVTDSESASASPSDGKDENTSNSGVSSSSK